jgi:hypothetical protein
MKPRMAEPLSIDVRAEERGAVLTVNDRVNIDSSAVRDRLLAIMQQESPPFLNIDLSAVPYLIECAHQFSAHGSLLLWPTDGRRSRCLTAWQ